MIIIKVLAINCYTFNVKKKIFLNGRFLTQPITGVQRFAYEMILALDKMIESAEIKKGDFEFILVYSGEINNPIQLKNIKILKRGILKGNLWEQLELPFYTFNRLLINMCTIAPLLKRRQFVVVHDASFIVNPQYFTFLFRTWYKLAISILGRTVRQIVTVSEFSKQELIKYLHINSHRISVINNSPDHMKRFQEPVEPFKKKIDALKPYCLAVSSLSANKNFSSLSNAFDKIEFQNYKMVIAGGSSSSLQTAKPQKAVTYIGYVSNEELKYLYCNASLFIFPSFYEGFGLPPIEAMFLGCPVIASNTSSIPEILGDACVYFDPYDEDDIADKIARLIGDKSRLEELKQKGVTRAKKYTWTNNARQMFGLVKQFA